MLNPGYQDLTLIFRDPAMSSSMRGRHTTVDREVPKAGCAFEIRSTDEEVTNTDISKVKAMAWLPWDDDCLALTERDAIAYRGRVYEIDGPTHPWTDYEDRPDHVQCTLVWQGG